MQTVIFNVPAVFIPTIMVVIDNFNNNKNKDG